MFYEPLCKKTGLRGFRPGSTQIGLYSHRSRLEACFGYKLKRNGTICVAKTKPLISCYCTADLCLCFRPSIFSSPDPLGSQGELIGWP